jgi:uncharacterized membrane protein
MSDEELSEIKVDVGVLKTQVLTLSTLCNKMDKVMDKLMEQHDRHISKVYTDMDNRRMETDNDIKEIHDRIDNVLDKLQASELRIMEKIENLRNCLLEHRSEEKQQLDKLLQWKWMVVGGVIALSWLTSHVNLDILSHLIAK